MGKSRTKRRPNADRREVRTKGEPVADRGARQPIGAASRFMLITYCALCLSVACAGVIGIAAVANALYGSLYVYQKYTDTVGIYPMRDSRVKEIRFWFSRKGRNAGDLVVSAEPSVGIYGPLIYYVETDGTAQAETRMKEVPSDRHMGHMVIREVRRGRGRQQSLYLVKVYLKGLQAKLIMTGGGGDLANSIYSFSYPRLLIQPSIPAVQENESNVLIEPPAIRAGFWDGPQDSTLPIAVYSDELYSDTTFTMMRPPPVPSQAGDVLKWYTRDGRITILAQGSKSTSVKSWLGYVLLPAAVTAILASTWKFCRSAILRRIAVTTPPWLHHRFVIIYHFIRREGSPSSL